MTIIEAIKHVMREQGVPMTAKEAYDHVVASNLYEFHAQQPAHVVTTQIRRHSEGIDFPTAAPTKHFKLVGEGKFFLLDQPKRVARKASRGVEDRVRAGSSGSLEVSFEELRVLQGRYVEQVKARVLAELHRLSPGAFEIFARQLLDAYGFEDTHVTRVSRDGGIDGYGKLKVGLAHLKVAFQCKRWKTGKIHRTEIDKFRGAAQGAFEQGIFFATTSFSQGAIKASIKGGAVPIVLLDAGAILNLMMEKKLGIQMENLAIPIYALDLALTPENDQLQASNISALGRVRLKRRAGPPAIIREQRSVADR